MSDKEARKPRIRWFRNGEDYFEATTQGGEVRVTVARGIDAAWLVTINGKEMTTWGNERAAKRAARKFLL